MSFDELSTPSAAGGTTSSLPRWRVALLFTVVLVTASGNTAMQTVMPSIGTELKVQDFWISLAYTWSALLWMICAPLWARRSDKRGRKAMMGIGLLGFIASFGLCGLALWLGLNGWLSGVGTLLLFAAFRSLYGGFGSAAPPAVQAYVASRTNRAQRTQSLSLIASSFALGTVIGPALAPLFILPGLGLTGPFVAFTLIAVVVLIALRAFLPSDDPAFAGKGDITAAPFSTNSNTSFNSGLDEPGVIERAPGGPIAILKRAWSDRRTRPWLIAGLLGGHAQAAAIGIVGFLILDRLGLRATPHLGSEPISRAMIFGAFATLLAQWGLIPMLRLGPRASCQWGILVAAVGVAVLAVAGREYTIDLAVALISLGFGLFRPGFTSGASLAVSRNEQSQSAGVVASVNGAAYIFAPAVGVWLGFVAIELLCLAVIVFGIRHMIPDVDLVERRQI
jgi:MFS family permease